MSHNQFTPAGKDPVLWKMAYKRASFKKHLASYLMVNTFLWALWYCTYNSHGVNFQNNIPWPIWTTLGWGIGIVGHFSKAYIITTNTTEREYQKLVNKQ